jgi:hypothetical protein
MEVLLVASSVLLAAQYKRDPTQLRLPSTKFFRTQGTASTVDAQDVDMPDPMQESNVLYDGRTPTQENPEPSGEKGMALGPGEHNFYPDDFFYNRVPKGEPQVMPDPSRPRPKFPGRPSIPGVHNPVQVDMMNDIRTGNNRLPAATAIATAFRPSWVRNVADVNPSPRQESIREWSTETPRDASDKATVTQRYRQHGVATLNDFGKGGLPFDEPIRVRPDGLDPDPLRRRPTARYNTYALGDDLTQSMADYGSIPGLANGQRIEGPAFRQEGWDLMPDRDIQLQPSAAPIPLSGAGVRGGGRGASLGSFLGASIPPNPAVRQGVEWDNGATGNKGPVPGLPVRPHDDPLDKRFVHEDIDPTRAQTGASFKPEVPQGPTSLVGNKGAWKFSFDMKSLFDMPDRAKGVVETLPEKIVTLPENTRKDVRKSTAESKRRLTNIQPKIAKTNAFGATTFKTETSSTETVISSSDIGVAKKITTQEALPLGQNASGRRVAVEKSDAPLRLDAINDVASFNNDQIFERGGTLREPMVAPKADNPDYAQATVGTMRNGREFRRR